MHIPTIDEIKLNALSDEKELVRECEEKLVEMVETYAKALFRGNGKFIIVNDYHSDDHVIILESFFVVLGTEKCNSILKKMGCSFFEMDNVLYLFANEKPDLLTCLELYIPVMARSTLVTCGILTLTLFVSIATLMVTLNFNFHSLILLSSIYIILITLRVLFSIFQYRKIRKYGLLVNENVFYKLK